MQVEPRARRGCKRGSTATNGRMVYQRGEISGLVSQLHSREKEKQEMEDLHRFHRPLHVHCRIQLGSQ